MKNLFKISLAAIFITLFSCEEYLDVNDSKNNPGQDQLIPEVVLPGAQVRPSVTFMTTMNTLGNVFMPTWSGHGTAIQDPFGPEFRYQINTDFYSGIWDNTYVRTNNLTAIINYQGDVNYDHYKGAAKILKSFYFQYLVDIYGDIPYSEIHQRDELLFPKYDDAFEIYQSLVNQIDEAIVLLNTPANVTAPLGSNDVMMNGDVNKWIKFGNTVKLKLLVRLSQLAQSNATVATFVDAEYDELNNSNAEFISLNDGDVIINPGYSNDTGKQNPAYATYGFDPSENATFQNRRNGPTEYMVNLMNGTGDNRLGRLYAPRDGQGAIQGNTQGGDLENSGLGEAIVGSSTQDGYIMLAAESLFLQSEAVLRGKLTSGNAQQLFEDGIRASYITLGVGGSTANSVTAAQNYFGANANNAGIGWNGGDFESIAMQKYLALGGINGIETWIEFNRTGFPDNLPFPDNAPQTTTRPKRLLYPTSEYVGNSNNVAPFGQVESDIFNTSIFWDVN